MDDMLSPRLNDYLILKLNEMPIQSKKRNLFIQLFQYLVENNLQAAESIIDDFLREKDDNSK